VELRIHCDTGTMRAMKRTQAAFTLMELMVALAVMGILCAYAVPSFRQYSRDSRAGAAHNDLVTAFNLARSETLRRGVPIGVCASSDGAECSGSDDWSNGWIVFTDATGAASDLDADDQVLQIWGGYADDLTIEGLDSLNAIRYLNTGMLDAGGPAQLELFPEGCTGDRKREIEIAVAGSVSYAKTAC
jgi:type IV fimbrial biogenesis protein FimT